MELNLVKKIISISLLFISVFCFSQKNDTVFYGKNNIRSIEFHNENDKILLSFFSIQGDDLLTKDNFKYSYFDSIMGSLKVVQVENKSISQEYWISGNDTIYARAKFDSVVDEQVNRFIKYFSKNFVFPDIAFYKGINGKVYISFVVNKMGDITNLKVLTKIGYNIEDTVLNLVVKYGKWGLLKLNKETVNCYFKLPINFVCVRNY